MFCLHLLVARWRSAIVIIDVLSRVKILSTLQHGLYKVDTPGDMQHHPLFTFRQVMSLLGGPEAALLMCTFQT
jgi:hypothetical protein